MNSVYDKAYKTLNSYNFTRQFKVKYAVACAESVVELIKDPKVKSNALEAINITKKWLNNPKEVTNQQLADAARSANAAANAAATTATTAATTATTATTAANAANAANAYAAAAATNAADPIKLLDETIKNEYSELELLLIIKDH